jgi:hypothetical protein
MHKKFTFGLIALLGVSLFILGCDDSSDDSTTPEKTPLENAQDLVTALGGATPAVVDDSNPENVTVTMQSAASPTTDIIVAAKVTLNTGAFALTIPAGKKLDNKGTVNIDASGSVVLIGGTAGTGAKLTGAGKVVAGATEIVGGADGWQAITANVAIATPSSNADKEATITGTGGGVLKAGTGATITQTASKAGNKLTLTSVTVDVSAAGSIVLAVGAANPGRLELSGTATAGIVKTGSATGGSFSSTTNLDAIGGAAITQLAFASDVTPTCAAVADTLNDLRTQSTGAKIIVADGSNTTNPVVFEKDVAVTVS